MYYYSCACGAIGEQTFTLPIEATLLFEMTESGTYAVSGYTGELLHANIPPTYLGVAVTDIGEAAFSGCTSLSSVTIPPSVVRIGQNAFADCTGLTAVYVEDLAAWCNVTFKNYLSQPLHYAGDLYLNGELVEDLVIPGSITTIKQNAFYACRSMKSLVLSDGVKLIENSAFSSCGNLASVTVPESITQILYFVFENCSKLEAVYVDDLRSWCGFKFYSSTSNPLYYGGELYVNGEAVKDLVIPDGVTKIGENAFYRCQGITSVTIPASVTSIGEGAFFFCDNLTAVYVDDLAAWCKIAFADSSSTPLWDAEKLYVNGSLVEHLVIPDGVTSIGPYAFYSLKSLASVTIPATVTSIGVYAFYNAYSLATVHYAGTCAQWEAIEKTYSWDSYMGAYEGSYKVICSDGTLVKEGTKVYRQLITE
ncbi:MAG: leucine-rich repeat protein [Clostridia bacterium]|nr:leucine-rich repeat protein [Clostridia bacterium]